MSTTSAPAVLSNTLNTGYNSVWASLYDTEMLVPQIWGEIVKLYGPGIGLLEFLYMAGSIVPIAGTSKKLFEELSLVKTIELEEATGAVAAGGALTLHLAVGEFGGTTDNSYLSTKDSVVIPAKYITKNGVKATKPSIWQVTTQDTNDTITKHYTLYGHDILDRINVTIPAGTKLMVTGGAYANGVSGGTPKSAGWQSRTFVNSTRRQNWSLTGSQQSNQRYYNTLRGGGNGIFTKASMECDFLLSKYINDDLMLGQLLTATAITMADRDLNNITPTNTLGMLGHMVAGAMKQYYTTAYQYSDFDDVKPLLLSQGITGRNVNFFQGSELYKMNENAGLDFKKEFAGGTKLGEIGEIDASLKFVHKNGVDFVFKELPSLSDPTSYGADSFDDFFKGLGFMIPDLDVTVKGSMEEPAAFKMKNLALGYKSYAGENRTRINKVLPGIANVGQGTGDIAVSDYDDLRGEMLSEYCLIFLKRNQSILIQNDNIL
jgi:hypothetical protein